MREFARPDQFVTTCMALPAARRRRRGARPRARRRRGQPVLRDAGRAHDAGGPAGGRAAACGGTARGRLGDLPRRPTSRAAPSKQPFLVTETNAIVDRRVALELPRLPRPVAPGGVGARLPRRADDRVLALAHAALRARDVLARRRSPHGEPGPLLRRGQADRRRVRAPGAAVADLVPDADVAPALVAREPVGDGVPAAARRRGRPRARSRLLRPHLRPLLRGPVRRRPAGRRRLPAASRQRRRRRSSRAGRCSSCPALYIADDVLLDLLDAYARAGGHSWSASAPATPTTRRGRARRSCPAGCARRRASATTSTRTSRCRFRCAKGGRGFDAPRGRGRDGVGRRARARGRRDARGATSTRISGAGRRSRRTRTATGASPTSARCPTGARGGPRPLAADLRHDAWADAARDGDGHERPQPPTAGGCGSCPTGPGSRRSVALPVAAQTCCPRRSSAVGSDLTWRHGMSGCSWRPREENNEEGRSS